MLAQRPVYRETVEDDMFAGMSFPDVPTNSIVIEKDHVNGAEIFADTISSNAFVNATVPECHVVLLEHRESTKEQHNWNSLYPTERLIERNMYPSLPASMPTYVPSDTTVLPNSQSDVARLPIDVIPPASVEHHMYTGDAPVLHHNYAPTAPPITNAFTGHHPLSAVYNQSVHQESVHYPPDVLSSKSSSSSSASSATHIQLHSQAMVPTQLNMLQGAAVATSMTDKYICCGGCRMWLKAPREVQMVHCPQCNSINNCGVAPPPSTTLTRREAPNYYGSGLMEWLSFCFENLPGDISAIMNVMGSTQTTSTGYQQYQQQPTPLQAPPPPDFDGYQLQNMQRMQYQTQSRV